MQAGGVRRHLRVDGVAVDLGGLAGESRSGDANGQWFRVLVAPGNYAYPAGSNFFLTGTPLKGVNPPPPANRYPRPYKPDVPCETQQAPDLRSNPGALPTPISVDLASPAVKAGVATATTKAVEWLRNALKRDGGSMSKLKVTDKPLSSLAQIGKGR